MFVGHGEEEDLRPVKVSTINFVDLAGSERGAGSGQETTAERLRQTEVGVEVDCCLPVTDCL